MEVIDLDTFSFLATQIDQISESRSRIRKKTQMRIILQLIRFSSPSYMVERVEEQWIMNIKLSGNL